MKFFFFIISIFFYGSVFSKDTDPKTYDYYREKYQFLEEGNARAFLYLKPYIQKAKDEKKYDELFQAYKDATFYSKSIHQKLQYADSCIDAAYKSKSDDQISSSYVLRGSIYYAKQKKYKLALDEYLMAYKYSKNSSDLYLKNKISYQLGVVKNYLGYHDEALELFKICLEHFETESIGNSSTKENKI